MTVELLLVNPKYGHNVGGAVRAAATLGAEAVWYTGDRVQGDFVSGRGKFRIPREERLRDYGSVRFGPVDVHRVFDDVSQRATPVAVELVPGAEGLEYFEHPEDAVYVFGPEDGSLGTAQLRHCHRFVQIPSDGCVNLAAAVYITLYDRRMKELVDRGDREEHTGE